MFAPGRTFANTRVSQVEGIGATISFALQRLISSVSNNQSERKGYVIAVGPLGGVCKYICFLQVRLIVAESFS